MYMGNWFSGNNGGRKTREFEEELKRRREILELQISDEKKNKLMSKINTEIKKLRKQGFKAYAIIDKLNKMGHYHTIDTNNLKIEDEEIRKIMKGERMNAMNM